MYCNAFSTLAVVTGVQQPVWQTLLHFVANTMHITVYTGGKP